MPKISGDSPDGGSVVDEIVDAISAQAPQSCFDVFETVARRSWEFLADVSLAAGAELIADSSSRAAQASEAAEARDVLGTDQRELSDLHVGRREVDAFRPFGGDRHAAHDDLDFPPFEGGNEVVEGQPHEFDRPVEGFADDSGEIRLDADDFAGGFKNDRRVIRRDADSEGRGARP